MASLDFRSLSFAEFDSAYGLVTAADAWLRERHLPAYLVPPEKYAARQKAGENFGLFDQGILRAVVTLGEGMPDDWAALIVYRPFLWLSTLASDRRAQAPYGRDLMRFAEDYARSGGNRAVYLDCYVGNGKLPEYYLHLGYKWIERKLLIFNDGTTHDSVLMCKTLAD